MYVKIYLSESPTLKYHEVHIWSACLPKHENYVAYFASILSKDEQVRAKKFKFLKDQKQFTIARGILRCLLARYLRCLPQNIEIIYGLQGKPALLAKNLVYFNLSHSKDYALYAITQAYEVGIDIEYIDKNFYIENEMLNMLPKADFNNWSTLSAEDKTSTFFKGWVSQEAFLKAYGKGWLGHKDETQYRYSSASTQKSEKKSSNSLTYPHYFELIPGYASALFVVGPFLQPLYYVWDHNLISSKLYTG